MKKEESKDCISIVDANGERIDVDIVSYAIMLQQQIMEDGCDAKGWRDENGYCHIVFKPKKNEKAEELK